MDRNSAEGHSNNQIVIRDASAEDALAIMHIWNANISSTLNTFNSHIKTDRCGIKAALLSSFYNGRNIFVITICSKV